MSKSKAKMLEREPKEGNAESRKNENKGNDPSREKMILGLITLKHNLGLFILSFEIINLGLHYVLKKSILIKYGYLD